MDAGEGGPAGRAAGAWAAAGLLALGVAALHVAFWWFAEGPRARRGPVQTPAAAARELAARHAVDIPGGRVGGGGGGRGLQRRRGRGVA